MKAQFAIRIIIGERFHNGADPLGINSALFQGSPQSFKVAKDTKRRDVPNALALRRLWRRLVLCTGTDVENPHTL
jgi:hypothetical protein